MTKLALTLPGGYNITPPDGIPQGGTTQIQKIVTFGITFLFITATLLALFFLIYGGIKWITSGGDKAGVESARKIVTYAVIGLVVVLASYIVLSFVTGIFGVSYLPVP